LSADLYIGAGGTITWERFACGLPGIVYSIAQNQVKMARDLASQGYQPYAGSIDTYSWSSLEQIITGIKEVRTRWDISKKMRALVDGHGTSRIIKAWGL
jgi:UDP-2,4-diacetamido-2,4,6-trideoxy-beta-L-altropyranose hydrolase